jgi:hypothetical protein
MKMAPSLGKEGASTQRVGPHLHVTGTGQGNPGRN